MIRTSNQRYIIINTQGYEKQIAVPTGKKEGERIEVYAFMPRLTERFIWVRRDEIFEGEYTQMKLL